MAEFFDAVYKIITGVTGLAILGLLYRIASRIGSVEQWIKTTDKEVTAHGTMLQQLTSKVAEIAGWMRGKFQKGGTD